MKPQIDWEKVVLALAEQIDDRLYKDLQSDDYELGFLIETAMIAAGELENYSK